MRDSSRLIQVSGDRSVQLADLSVRPERYSLNADLEIKANEAPPFHALEHWNVADSIERDVFLRPALAFTGRDKELRAVLAYVTNENSNTVTVIDRSFDRVIDVIQAGSRPRGIVAAPDFSNTALNSVSVMDATTFHTIELIPVERQPLGSAVDPNGTKVLVANSGANTVSVIDTGANRVVTTIPVEFQPISVAVDPSGTRAFVSHFRSTRMLAISLSNLRIETRVNTGPAAAVLSDGTFRRVFVGLLNQNRLGLFDATIDAQLATAPVGQEPNRIVLDADRGKLYVVNRGSDNISVLDKNTLRARTEIPTDRQASVRNSNHPITEPTMISVHRVKEKNLKGRSRSIILFSAAAFFPIRFPGNRYRNGRRILSHQASRPHDGAATGYHLTSGRLRKVPRESQWPTFCLVHREREYFVLHVRLS